MTPEEIRKRLEGAEILIVPYAHCDWAWTHTRAWHERRYVLAFEEVLQILRADPGFRWYLDCWITELHPLLDRRPDLVPELQERVRQGQIAVCGAFSNVRPNMVGEETFLRNLIHGRRRFGSLFPEADLSVHADIVDVSLGHPQMPQVLALAGYRYFRAWRPQPALSAKGVPYEFLWEGLDGSRVLCSRGCYGGLVAPGLLPEGFAEEWDATVARLWERELEIVARHSPTRLLWVSQGMDDARPLRTHGGDASIDVPGLIREWNRRGAAPMRFATPVEFFRALESRSDDVPVVRGTLDPCDVCFNAAFGGSSGLWRLRFRADHELTTAEAWQVAADSGESPAALWENLLLFSAHATQWVFQDDFDELHSLAQDTCRAARAIRRESQDALARRVPQPEGCAAVVFNSLPYERWTTVPVLLTAAEGIPGHVRLVDGDGQPVAFQVVNDLAVGLKVWERQGVARVKLPAFGYTTISWEPLEMPIGEGEESSPDGFAEDADAGPNVLLREQIERALQDLSEREQEILRLRFGLADGVPHTLEEVGSIFKVAREQIRQIERKAVRALRAASGGAESVLDNGILALSFDPGNLVAVETKHAPYLAPKAWSLLRLYDVDPSGPLHVGAIRGTQDARWDEARVVERGPVRWRHVAQGSVGPHPVMLETLLYAGEARVEFRVEVDWRGWDGFLAALWPMPFDGQITGDVPFGAEVKDLDAERYGPVRDDTSRNLERLREGMFYARSFVSLSDGARGITHVAHDGDRYYVRDREGGTLAHILVNSVRHVTEGWEQHVNRQREAVGRHAFAWSLFFHPGDWRTAGMVRAAASLRSAAEVLLPHGAPHADLPPADSLLSVEPANVVLSALYAEGGAVFLRVWEAEGRLVEVVVRLPFAPLSATAVGLNGEPRLEPVPRVDGRALRFMLRPWQIATVRMTR